MTCNWNRPLSRTRRRRRGQSFRSATDVLKALGLGTQKRPVPGLHLDHPAGERTLDRRQDALGPQALAEALRATLPPSARTAAAPLRSRPSPLPPRGVAAGSTFVGSRHGHSTASRDCRQRRRYVGRRRRRIGSKSRASESPRGHRHRSAQRARCPPASTPLHRRRRLRPLSSAGSRLARPSPGSVAPWSPKAFRAICRCKGLAARGKRSR